MIRAYINSLEMWWMCYNILKYSICICELHGRFMIQVMHKWHSCLIYVLSLQKCNQLVWLHSPRSFLAGIMWSILLSPMYEITETQVESYLTKHIIGSYISEWPLLGSSFGHWEISASCILHLHTAWPKITHLI